MVEAMTLADVTESLVRVEGGYTNNPDDLGGETIWGITVATARLNGYDGDMKDMSRQEAKDIYMSEYILRPGFDKVFKLSQPIGMEVIDTGVNMGQPIAAMLLQRALNVFNGQGVYYPDVKQDGKLGIKTYSALEKYLERRGKVGETVLLRCLNALQGERYVSITEQRQRNEEFIFGWFLNRVVL